MLCLNTHYISQQCIMYLTKMENRGVYVFYAKFIIPIDYKTKFSKSLYAERG